MPAATRATPDDARLSQEPIAAIGSGAFIRDTSILAAFSGLVQLGRSGAESRSARRVLRSIAAGMSDAQACG